MALDQNTSQGFLMLYLIGCLLNCRQPNKEFVSEIDTPVLLYVAKKHSLGALTAYAMKYAGLPCDEAYRKYFWPAVRKKVLVENQRVLLLDLFEKEGISYLPMKGIVLEKLYPKTGLREMSDNDILIDKDRAADVKRLMEAAGYTCQSFGSIHHDVYTKPPFFVFEMHRTVFDEANHPEYRQYYSEIKGMAIKDDNNAYGYHFSLEEFYLHIIFHAMSHYQTTGIGLRAVIDVYLYLRTYTQKMDWAYIQNKLSLVSGAAEFETLIRAAATKAMVMTPDELRHCPELAGFMKYTHTTVRENVILHNLEKAHVDEGFRGKLNYVAMRVSAVNRSLWDAYPELRKHRYLRPLYFFGRLFSMMKHRKKALRKELSMLMNYDETSDNTEE